MDFASITSTLQVWKDVSWKNAYGETITRFAFRRPAVEAVLAGDQTYVTYMFTWAETPPELRNTWSECHLDTWYANQGQKPRKMLNEEQKAFLRWLIRPEVEDHGE